MVFKDTSNKFRFARAMTLIELLVAGAITAVLSTAICTSLVFSSRSLVGLSNYIEMDSKSRNALDHLMVDMRDMQKILSLTSNSTSATLRGLRWSNDVEVVYFWNGNDTTLQRTFDGETKTLLTNCESLTFRLKPRRPGDPDTTASLCKYIQISWTCRKSIGHVANQLWNTETVQTAGIMLRNQH